MWWLLPWIVFAPALALALLWSRRRRHRRAGDR
jgi:hypothetical protein